MKNIFKYSPGFLAGVILSSAFAGAAAANSNLITNTIDELWVFVAGDPVLASQVNENFEYLESKIDATLPSGTIVIWSGEEIAIPVGWSLCDGTNGTPDLINRFVLGAGSWLPVNETGGAESHIHLTGGYQNSGPGGEGYAYLEASNMPPYWSLCYIQKQ